MRNLMTDRESFFEINLPHQLYKMATTKGFIEYSINAHGNFAKMFLTRLIEKFEKKDYSFVECCDYEAFRKDFIKFKRTSFYINA